MLGTLVYSVADLEGAADVEFFHCKNLQVFSNIQVLV